MLVSERIKLYRKVCINDKDRNRTKQHVCNSIDPQQMLDRGMIRLDAIRYGHIRINAFSYVPLPTITDRPSAHAFLTVMKICPRIYRALRIRYVQLRTLRMRYESLRIGRTDTEHLSAASAAYVSPIVRAPAIRKMVIGGRKVAQISFIPSCKGTHWKL